MASLNRQSATRIDFKRGMTLAPRVAFEIKPATRFEPRIDFIPQLHSPSDPRCGARTDFEVRTSYCNSILVLVQAAFEINPASSRFGPWTGFRFSVL